MKSDQENYTRILEYVVSSNGLEGEKLESGYIRICQKTDGKMINVRLSDIGKVISRLDTHGNSFLQVNFTDERRILITENLVGFKPSYQPDMDMEKLPKVVTTPDLVSVVEAIVESMHATADNGQEVDLLRRVFGSVLEGGEAVGFDLSGERHWMCQIANLEKEPRA